MHFRSYGSCRPSWFRGDTDSFIDLALSGGDVRWSAETRDSRDRYSACNEYVIPLAEKAWKLIGRPYYNVYPIVIDLCRSTKLNVPWSSVCFPFAPLLFRFPAGHEPHCISTALIYLTPHPETQGWDFGDVPAFASSWAEDPASAIPAGIVRASGLCESARAASSIFGTSNLIAVVQFVLPSGPTTSVWSLRADTWSETVEETVAVQPPDCKDPGSIYDSDAASFLARMAVFGALVGRGEDLITPAILAKDERRYESAGDRDRKWLEDRAARVHGRGFHFGRELQSKSESSPHWRNPHMALFWTGEKRARPVLKLRSGCVVIPRQMNEIPTGFLDNESKSDSEESSESVVYQTKIPKRVRFRVMRRDKFCCQICGLTQKDGVRLEVDHKIPRAKGGSNDEQNLWTLCQPCNSGKSDSDLHESCVAK